MARTKQSAQKSTGAPAPRRSLPSRAKAQLLDTETPQPAPRRSNRKKTPTGSNVDAPVVEETTIATGPATEDTPSNDVIPMEVDAQADDHNEFCSGCRNGGTMLACGTCERVLCDRCVDFPATIPEDDDFKCPTCHLQPPGAKKWNIAPYYAFSSATQPTLLRGGAATRETFAPCRTPAVVILSVRLASIDPVSDSARVVFHNIASHLPNQVQFVDLPWDLGDDQKTQEYNERVKALVDRLEHGDLKHYRTFAVYVTNHSDPERGDLHFTVNDQGAAEVGQVLETLFPPSLTAFFNEGQSNTLTMLVCGALVTISEAHKALKDFVNRGHFAWGMAFSQPHLQPCLTNPMLQTASVAWFVKGRRWDSCLEDLQSVGSHTDILLLLKGQPTIKYIWAHPSRRPFGEVSPHSCPECLTYKPWGAPTAITMRSKAHAQSITHTCRHCGLEQVYICRESLKKHSKGVAACSSNGDWYREVLG